MDTDWEEVEADLEGIAAKLDAISHRVPPSCAAWGWIEAAREGVETALGYMLIVTPPQNEAP